MSSKNRYMKHMLQWLIAGSRGGPNRAKILEIIKEEPMNANQLCKELEVDYRTIRHHLEILEKNGLVSGLGPKYGRMYFLSADFEEVYLDFEEILKGIGKRDNKEGAD